MVRTLFELEVLVKYSLSVDTDDIANLFLDYESLERIRMHNANNDNPEIRAMLRLRANYQEVMNQLKSEAESARKNENRMDENGRVQTSTWSGKQYEEMARLAGLEESYNITYRLLSQLTHSTPRITSFYLVDREDGVIQTKTDPSEAWVEESLVKAFDFLFDLASEYNQRFSCDLKEELQAVLAQHLKTFSS